VSLLADLLSKVKYKSTSGAEGRKTDVPPDLKRVVSSSTEKEAIKRRIIIFSILTLLAIISGVVAVYFMELYIKPSTKKVVRSQESGVRSQRTEVKNHQLEEKTELPDSKLGTQNSDAKGESSKPQAPATKPEPSASKPKAAKPKPAKERPTQKEVTEEKKTTEEQPPKPTGEDLPRDSQERAVTAQEPRIKTHDSQKDVYLYTARTHESKKDYHQALSNYKKALEIDHENYIIMNNISSVLIHLGSFEESIKYSKNALNIRKDYVPSLINLGIAYIRLNNLAEGEGYLSRALSIESSNSYALLNFGILYEKRGDNDKAYSYFSKLSDIGNIQGYLGIARILEKQGKTSDAVRIYKEIISMNNIDPKIKKLANDRLLQLQ